MASSSSSQLKPLLDDPQFTPYTQLGDLDENGKFVPKTDFKNTMVFADMIMPKLSKSEAEITSAPFVKCRWAKEAFKSGSP